MEEQEVICPSCSMLVGNSKNRCPNCNSEILFKNQYKLLKILGSNVGITYLAFDIKNNKKVVIKELSIHKLQDWKNEELFQREIQILQQLDHPGIPKYLAHFTITAPRQYIYYLVLEHIEGINLADEMMQHRYSEKEVLDIMFKVLEILEYLHSLSPQIIHRDIKPSNLIRKPDGGIALIDFGSVKDLTKGSSRQTTVTGTFGFMAPEQYYGHAGPRSDLYGLGMVAAVLLSRLHPEKMISSKNELRWKEHMNVSQKMINALEIFLAKDIVNRPLNASAAIKLVKNVLEEKPQPAPEIKPVKTSVIVADNQADSRELVRSTDRSYEVSSDDDSTKKRSLIAAGITVLALFLVFFLSQIVKTRTKNEAGTINESIQESEYEAEYNVPMGIKGLSFGMTLDEVIEVLPEAENSQEFELDKVEDYYIDWEFAMRPEGFRIIFDTDIGDLPCTAELYFAVDNTLSRITLTVQPRKSLESHEAVEQTILEQFYMKYGKEDYLDERKPQFDFETEKINRKWTWEGVESTLTFTSFYDALFSDLSYSSDLDWMFENDSILVIDNIWNEHEKIINYYIDLSSQKQRLAEEQRQKEQEEEKLRELEELKNLEIDIGNDL